jgi:hypothetical protein
MCLTFGTNKIFFPYLVYPHTIKIKYNIKTDISTVESQSIFKSQCTVITVSKKYQMQIEFYTTSSHNLFH